MSIQFKFRLEAKISVSSPSLIALELPEVELKYPAPSKGVAACLSQLQKGARLDDLIALWDEESGEDSTAHFFFFLEELHRHRFLSYTARGEKGPIATLHPFNGFRWDSGGKKREEKVHLSRFAYLRRDGEKMIVESPLSFAKLEIQDPLGLEILMRIATPAVRNEIEELDGARAFLELLNQGAFLERDEPELKFWQFSDLLFHSRSRAGRHEDPFGGTFPFLGKTPPLPAVRPQEGVPISLKKVDLEALKKNDIPFSKVLEERRSVREYGPDPITLDQLGEFLFRSACVRSVGQNGKYETVFRAAAGGGACHPIEIYPLVAQCQGLEPGLYHYDRHTHALRSQAPFSEEAEELLKLPEKMLQNGAKAQVLLIFAARFGRTFWKYQSIGYATILKDAGALMQTMYLVATAMGLAPCANGAGNSDLFAKLSGLDYYTEGSVGEFLVGSKCSL